MNRQIYDIQIKSLRRAVEHMTMIDLTELAQSAIVHGTPEDKALLAAVRTLLGALKHNSGHH